MNTDKLALVLSAIKDNYTAHYRITIWGGDILLMEKRGIAFGRIYWYTDEFENIYIEGLSVDTKARKRGMGRELLEMLEKIGIRLGAKTSFLWVDKTEWMYEWYKRKGYVFLKEHCQEENTVWMSKPLIHTERKA